MRFGHWIRQMSHLGQFEAFILWDIRTAWDIDVMGLSLLTLLCRMLNVGRGYMCWSSVVMKAELYHVGTHSSISIRPRPVLTRPMGEGAYC